jgi:protoheme IX farnesyltransferase
MMSVTHPDLCRRVALRYSAGCIAICTLAPVVGVTDWAFALDSLPLNAGLTFLAWKFYRDANSSSSRKLFRFTLIHLPLLLTLMFISKKSTTVTAAEIEATAVSATT